MDIGVKIKKLRVQKNMTLKELSEKSNLSIGFLSQLERGLTTIAVDSLERLAEIFDVPFTYFFGLPHRKKEIILRDYQKEVIDIQDNEFIYYNLSNDLANKSFVPKLIEIFPHKEQEKVKTYSHKGEEFVYVLEGILTFFIQQEKHDLYPGDSVHINSDIPHNWANYTNKKVKILTINYPNYIYCTKDENDG